MDDRKTSISSHHLCGRIGADAAPIARGVRRSADVEDELVVPLLIKAEKLPDNPLREGPVVVYPAMFSR